MFHETDSSGRERGERLPDEMAVSASKPNSTEPAYYEAWHVPADSDCVDLHSPNYHRTMQSFETGRIRPVEPVHEKATVKEKKSNGRFLRGMCLVLLCALISSLCSALVVEYRLSAYSEQSKSTEASAIQIQEPESQDDSQSSAVKAATGTCLTATEIYNLACRQSVGIQVTSTGYNIWGQLVSGNPISGSGFVVSENGYLVTNYHVIENAAKSGKSDITVQFYDESSYPATLVGYDAAADLAVLKIDAEGLSAVKVGSMDSCQVGSRVYAIGNPLGELTFTMTDGMICALDRVITTQTSNSINVFQINAAVNSGNSGGPVYNERGEVIGIVDAKYAATGVEGIGFAIPLDDAVGMINDLVANGYVTGRAYLGVHVRTITSSVAAYYGLPEGAYIDYVEENSCSAKAGLQAGDILTQIGSYEIKGADDVYAAKSAHHAGETVSVSWYRSGETLSAELTFDEDTQ